MEISYNELLEKARAFSQNKILWHHHYLPPDCQLNKFSKHLIILETKNQSWEATFDVKPMSELEKLENLFFNRG